MNYKVFIPFALIIILSNISLAQVGNFSEADSYAWLNKTLVSAGWSKPVIDSVIDLSAALMALMNKGYDVKQGINNLKAAEDASGCWPKGSCDVKTTAFATLALGSSGQDVSKEKKWLVDSQIATTAAGTFYLQVISGTEGSCEATCVGTSIKRTVKANSDWVDANTICSGITTSLSKSIEVDCTNLGNAIVSLLYNVKAADGSDTYYIVGESHETKSTLNTQNSCFPAKRGETSCNYDAGEFASWVLHELNKEDIYALNYLRGNIRASVIDNSLLYLITQNAVYSDWLKQQQKPSGSFQDDVKGTAFATLALKQSTADFGSYNNATIWLQKKRSSDYSWNNDIFNTAIVLLALHGKIEQKVVIAGCKIDADCPLGKSCNSVTSTCVTKVVSCATDIDCKVGEVCDTVTKVCKVAAVVGCVSDLDCESGQTCSDGQCIALGGCQSDIDCASGETCDLSTNNCISAPIVCTSDLDCGENERCIDGACEIIPAKKKFPTGALITIIILLLLLGGGALFYFKYIKIGKKFDVFGGISNIFKKKPKKPSFEEYIRTQPKLEQRPLLPERPSRKQTIGKEEEELEKSIREAEKLLHGK